MSDNDRLKWKWFTHFFQSDLRKFNKAFEPKHANVGVEEQQFMRYSDGDFTIYVYSHEKYERCGESNWSNLKNLFAAGSYENYRVSKPKHSRACGIHLALDSDYKHLMLLPFYHDNEAIQSELMLLADLHRPAKEMLQKLKEAHTNQEKEGMFAYNQDFFEGAARWDENHWSKRLGSCLPELSFFNQARYKVKYTATKWMELFHAKEIVKFFKFHGAPDLVIKDLQRNECVPMKVIKHPPHLHLMQKNPQEIAKAQICLL